MKWLLILLINCMLLSGLLCACVAPPPPQPTPDEIAEEIIVLINDEREAQGLEPFVVNEHLMLIAKWRSQDMVDGDYYSHTPPEGHPTLADFNERLGYNPMSTPSENLVYIDLLPGHTIDGTAERTVEAWRNSYFHWFMAMTPGDGMTGVGVVIGEDRIVVTQLVWFNGLFTPANAHQHNRETP